MAQISAAQTTQKILSITGPQLLATSDIVSLHCPLTPETTNLINTSAIATMKPTAVLINVARGGVVNEGDLAHATADTFEPTIRRMFDNIARIASGQPLPPKDEMVRSKSVGQSTVVRL